MITGQELRRYIATSALVVAISVFPSKPSHSIDDITMSQSPSVDKSCEYHPYDGVWLQNKIGDVCIAYNNDEETMSVFEYDSGSLFTLYTEPKLNIKGHKVGSLEISPDSQDKYNLFKEFPVNQNTKNYLLGIYQGIILLIINSEKPQLRV